MGSSVKKVPSAKRTISDHPFPNLNLLVVIYVCMYPCMYACMYVHAYLFIYLFVYLNYGALYNVVSYCVQ